MPPKVDKNKFASFDPKYQDYRPIGRDALMRLLNSYVCEVKFYRKHDKEGYDVIRKVLCTTSKPFLMSSKGMMTLNYRPTDGVPKPWFNRRAANVICVWDIFMQDYRNIWCNSIFLLSKIPADEKFWKYFREVLAKMTTQQKMEFMDNSGW